MTKPPSWERISTHLSKLLAVTYESLATAPDLADVYRLQGRAEVLKDLLYLPETLALIDNSDTP